MPRKSTIHLKGKWGVTNLTAGDPKQSSAQSSIENYVKNAAGNLAVAVSAAETGSKSDRKSPSKPTTTDSPSIKLNIDSLIKRLLNMTAGQKPGREGRHPSLRSTVLECEIIALTDAARELFMSQPPFLEIEAPIKVCGDVHGQFSDLLRLFKATGYPSDTNGYLFLGDYVDRGKQSIETICLLFCYKLKYPNRFYMLRGNHETSNINRIYGFYDECQRRYSVKCWHSFQATFNCMPLCALISRRIMCMHGGLSPKLSSLDQLHQIKRPIDINRGTTMLVDLLWSDPDIYGYGWRANTRGISYTYGPDVVDAACKLFNLDLIARAHQVVQDGYELFADRKHVTIFSAPHYCGQFENSAGIMKVDDELQCTFECISPILGHEPDEPSSRSDRGVIEIESPLSIRDSLYLTPTRKISDYLRPKSEIIIQ